MALPKGKLLLREGKEKKKLDLKDREERRHGVPTENPLR